VTLAVAVGVAVGEGVVLASRRDTPMYTDVPIVTNATPKNANSTGPDVHAIFFFFRGGGSDADLAGAARDGLATGMSAVSSWCGAGGTVLPHSLHVVFTYCTQR
jgi:hypothetical protein